MVILVTYLTERGLIIKDSCIIAPNHDVTGDGLLQIYHNYTIPGSEALWGPTKTFRLKLSESEEGHPDKNIRHMVG